MEPSSNGARFATSLLLWTSRDAFDTVTGNIYAAHRFRGATLDVFWNVASVDPCFARLVNGVQPHRSSATVETRTKMAGLVRDSRQAFVNGEPLLTEYTCQAAQSHPYKTILRHSRP